MIISNNNLLEIVDKKTALKTAKQIMFFAKVSKGLLTGITSLGLINLDFADVKTVMADKGNAYGNWCW